MRMSPLLVSTLCLVACSVAVAQPQRRVELSFSGTTYASQFLIEDVIRNVMDLGDDELGCSRPDSVVAEVLPEDFMPAQADPAPDGAGMPVYERWTVNFCGKEVPVLLTFWSMAHGGTTFGLQFPFEETVSVADDPATRLQ